MLGDTNVDASATIGTTSVVVLNAQPPQRTLVEYTITNTSGGAQIISLSTGSPGAAGEGVVLQPGQFWSESLDARFTPSNEARFAIASGAGGTIAIHVRAGNKKDYGVREWG